MPRIAVAVRTVSLYAILVPLACLAPVPAQAISRVVAVTGDAAPDGSGSLSTFGIPALNDAGQVAFHAVLTSTSGDGFDNRGIFRANEASFTQIARGGQAAPDGNGSFLYLQSGLGGETDVALNDAGQAVFNASLNVTGGGSIDEYGIFSSDGTTLTQIARRGQIAPDGNGSFSTFSEPEPAINDAGQVAFAAALTGTRGGDTDHSGIFRGDGTNLTQIVRTGDLAPDGNGRFFGGDWGYFGYPTLNNAGQVAFASLLTSTSGGDNGDGSVFDNSGIFRGEGTTLIQIARTGDAAPDGNGSFAGFRLYEATVLNDAGQVAFVAGLTGTSGVDNDDSGIFRGDGTTLMQIAHGGDTAPDRNGNFSTFGEPVLNDKGQVAFRAVLTSTSGGDNDNGGIFRGDGTHLTQIAREGDPVPGGNGIFAGNRIHDDFFDFGNPAINNSGQVAFGADVAGTSGGDRDNSGIFFFDDRLGLLQVAREGDLFLGSTLASLWFADSAFRGDEHSGLNKLGQVAYGFTLADGRQGIAVWSIPEPASVALFVLGAPMLLARHCRSFLPSQTEPSTSAP